MAKREYNVQLPLTGYATGTVIAESEQEAVDIFAEECESHHIDWSVDASNANVTEGDLVEDEENENL